MFASIDLLASEYGWAKNDILKNVYIDELLFLADKIRVRKAEDYIMHLSIITNPHIQKPSDRKLLWDALKVQTKKVDKDEKLDKAGFERFKQTIMNTSKQINVK